MRAEVRMCLQRAEVRQEIRCYCLKSSDLLQENETCQHITCKKFVFPRWKPGAKKRSCSRIAGLIEGSRANITFAFLSNDVTKASFFLIFARTSGVIIHAVVHIPWLSGFCSLINVIIQDCSSRKIRQVCPWWRKRGLAFCIA